MNLESKSCENDMVGSCASFPFDNVGGGWDEIEESDHIYYPQVREELKPRKDQEFTTIEDAKIFYNTYAKESGFSIRANCERKKDGVIIRKEFVCYKEGKGLVVQEEPKQRRRGSIKECCLAKIAFLMSNVGLYVVSVFVEGHSHPLSTPSRTFLLRSHRSISNAHKCLSEQLSMVNIPSHQQFNFLAVQAGGIENIGCTQTDLYNYERDRRIEMSGHDGDLLFEYFKIEQDKNPSFTFKIEADEKKHITCCFWADGTSRRAYNFFGDVVIFDTTYNTNRYGMIFAPFVGVNNHGQTIVFACAFLSDETIDSFVWLFKQFLEVMPGDAPKIIITDQDPAMTNAISEILSNTYHRYCSWHILTKFSEKLDSVKYNHYYSEFSDCIWKSELKEEFDSKWLELVGRSGLSDNKWLKSMYEIRSKWVPAHLNHVFSANMSSSQRAESSHAFFKRFVNKRLSLFDFMIQFGRGLAYQRHQELVAENKDKIETPKVILEHDFLLQMVNIYTREIFFEFQDELTASLLRYKFELIKDVDNLVVYKVQKKNEAKYKVREILYDKELDYAYCSCKKFESAGIPCRHLLAYLDKFHDYEQLPTKYILKRWTQGAKYENVVDNSGTVIRDDKEYIAKRREMVKFSLEVVDKALESEEGTKIYYDDMCSALEKINHLNIRDTNVRVSDEKSSPMLVVSRKCSASNEHVFCEPNQVRAKGCGKRLKGGKEKALVRAKQKKARMCHGCGKIGQTHDKRNCSALQNRSFPCNEDSSASLENNSFSSTDQIN